MTPRLLILLLALIAGLIFCSQVRVYGHVTQGDGAKAILTPIKPVRPPPPARTTNTYYWRGVAPGFWYNLQATSDFKTWECLRSNVTAVTEVTNSKASTTIRQRYYRLQGRPRP